MKSIVGRFLVPLGILALIAAPMAASAAGPKWENPVIGYGHVHPLPHAAVQPSKTKVYRAIFDVTHGIANHAKPDAGLVHVARAVNVFASAGVPLSHLKFVAIVHGPATPSILKDSVYRKKYGVNNPNLKLISELRRAGVKVDVCGQALADLDFAHSWVDSNVTITLSALSTVVIYGNKGYAYMAQ